MPCGLLVNCTKELLDTCDEYSDIHHYDASGLEGSRGSRWPRRGRSPVQHARSPARVAIRLRHDGRMSPARPSRTQRARSMPSRSLVRRRTRSTAPSGSTHCGIMPSPTSALSQCARSTSPTCCGCWRRSGPRRRRPHGECASGSGR